MSRLAELLAATPAIVETFLLDGRRGRVRCLEDGTWPLDRSPTGRVWFEVDDGQGKPSRWVTLRAMRVLRWWES